MNIYKTLMKFYARSLSSKTDFFIIINNKHARQFWLSGLPLKSSSGKLLI